MDFFLIALSIVSAFIIYQDFKSRRINTWLLLLFGGLAIASFINQKNTDVLLKNVLFCGAYLALCHTGVMLYYFIRKKNRSPFQAFIGWGDILVLFFTGITLSPALLIFFFTLSFLLAAVIHLAFFGTSKEVPLAAYLLLFYILLVILQRLDLIPSELLI
jgi:hypothetical protein